MQGQQRLGELIRKRREERGWSLREAAEHLGIHHTRLAEIERGVSRHTGRTSTPTDELIRRIAALYDLPADSLLAMAGYPHEAKGELDEQTAQLLHLFDQLDQHHRDLAVRLVQALRDGSRA